MFAEAEFADFLRGQEVTDVAFNRAQNFMASVTCGLLANVLAEGFVWETYQHVRVGNFQPI
jgi:hypothetical protein